MIKLCCVGCGGTHTLSAKEPIVFLCRVCRVVNSYSRGVIDYITTFEAYMNTTRADEVRAMAAFAYCGIADVVYKDSANEALVIEGGKYISYDSIFKSVPHEDAHALWRLRLHAE